MFSFIVGHSQSSHVWKKVWNWFTPTQNLFHVQRKLFRKTQCSVPDKQLNSNKYTEVNNGKSHGSSWSQHKKETRPL